MKIPWAEHERDWIADRTSQLVRSLIRDAWPLGIRVSHGPGGETVIDCGLNAAGTWETGRRIVEIAHGGLASATLGVASVCDMALPSITVESWRPAHSAFRLQVSLPLDEIDPAIRVSGPILARLRMRSEPDPPAGESRADAWGVAVVETDRWDESIAVALAQRADLPRSDLTLLLVPGRSVAGSTQIAGRINECVVFTLEESLAVDATSVVHMIGDVPVAPPALPSADVLPDDLIHYAGRAVLTMDAEREDLSSLAKALTFASTPHYGKRFSELLNAAGGVFEAIPGLIDLNKIAQVSLLDVRTGATFSAGARDETLLREWLRASRCEREVGS